jgi:DNA replication protein DnaC
MTSKTRNRLLELARALSLTTLMVLFEDLGQRAEKSGWSHEQYLLRLLEEEVSARQTRKIGRNLKRSALPEEKTLSTFNLRKIPAKVRRQVPSLCEGGFADRAENILAFGLPGRGKSHLCWAICHELVNNGYTVLSLPAYELVQKLLVAKRDLVLDEYLRKLDRFSVVMIDDIGYVKQSRDEMEVLFTFLSARYERRSVIITSNLVFSEWDQIFKSKMTTAAAIDRLVHHSTILELTGVSVRAEEAKARKAKG